jgi:hypothetical protein
VERHHYHSSRAGGGKSRRRGVRRSLIAVALGLLLVFAATAAAGFITFKGRFITFKGQGIDDEKVRVAFDYHHGNPDLIKDIEAKNVKFPDCPEQPRITIDFFLLEPVRVDHDGSFEAEYKNRFELYKFKGQFPEIPHGFSLGHAHGLFKVERGEGGREFGCHTGRVEWKAASVEGRSGARARSLRTISGWAS